MLAKIFGLILYAAIAILSTTIMCVWWYQFGTHEVYPYLATIITCISWLMVYDTIKTKEE